MGWHWWTWMELMESVERNGHDQWLSDLQRLQLPVAVSPSLPWLCRKGGNASPSFYPGWICASPVEQAVTSPWPAGGVGMFPSSCFGHPWLRVGRGHQHSQQGGHLLLPGAFPFPEVSSCSAPCPWQFEQREGTESPSHLCFSSQIHPCGRWRISGVTGWDHGIKKQCQNSGGPADALIEVI